MSTFRFVRLLTASSLAGTFLAAAILLAGNALPAAQAASDGGAPELKIDLQGDVKPAPAKPAKSAQAGRTPVPFDQAPKSPEQPASQPQAPAADKMPVPFAPSATPGAPAPSPAADAAKPGKPEPVKAGQPAPFTPGSAAKPGQKGKPGKPEIVAGDVKTAPRRMGEIVIGALLPLTGQAQAKGAAAKAALELARDDLGEYVSKIGIAQPPAILIEDTTGDPKTALERIKSLAVRGARVVIGPLSDDETAEVLEFAKANSMLLLGPASAGPFLANKKEGALLRFVPMNTHQAEAAAGLASQEGVEALVPLWEGDLYGDELVVHLKAHFRAMGGAVSPGVRYRPGNTSFASYITDLKNQIAQAQKQYKKVAIYFAGHNEIAQILTEADKAGLLGIRWYGCDATAFSPALSRDEKAADLARSARLVSPRYGETETEAYAALERRIQDKTKEFPGTESVVAYDLAWLAATVALICGGLDNIEAVKAVLPATAEHFHGVSGWMALNADGDRREDWGYDFWMVKKDKDKFYWEKFARYQFTPGGTKQFFIHQPE